MAHSVRSPYRLRFPTAALRLEPLEPREVPTATLLPSGTLLVEGRDDPSAADRITVQRSGNDLVVREDSTSQSFPVNQVTAIDVRGRRGGDRVEIDSVRALIPVTIDGGDGEDAIAICPSTCDLSNILGSTIAVQGGPGGDSLDICDDDNRSNATYTITATSVTRPFAGQITYAGVADLELRPTRANSTVNVRGTAAGTRWEVSDSGGTDTVNVGSPTAGLDPILGFVRTRLADVVRLNNSGGTNTHFTFSDWGTASWAGATRVDFLIAGRAEFNGGAGAERVVLDGFVLPSDLTVNGGGGSDTLEAASWGFPLPGNHWRVAGFGAGVVNGRATFSSVERLYDSGGGVLDYSATSSSVFVDLAAGSATGFASIAGMVAVIGSSTADILAAGGGGSILLGGGGGDFLIGGGGWDLLIGGAGADDLDGGGGDDILIGGTTAHDADPEALFDLWYEWTVWAAFLPYSDRVARLRAGTDSGYKLDATTVFVNDGARNTLTGGAGLDWFWCDAGFLGNDFMTDRDPLTEFLR